MPRKKDAIYYSASYSTKLLAKCHHYQVKGQQARVAGGNIVTNIAAVGGMIGKGKANISIRKQRSQIEVRGHVLGWADVIRGDVLG